MKSRLAEEGPFLGEQRIFVFRFLGLCAVVVCAVLFYRAHGATQKAIVFQATTLDGRTVNFPADYKGKLVILDFWATWCGPCMGEAPGLVSAYNEFHRRGVDVLGVSLDQPDAADQVLRVTGQMGMSWPQVYDGGLWQARIAQLYGIHSIPHAYLVDGDTGNVLAEGDSIRGGNLEGTLEKALREKSR